MQLLDVVASFVVVVAAVVEGCVVLLRSRSYWLFAGQRWEDDRCCLKCLQCWFACRYWKLMRVIQYRAGSYPFHRKMVLQFHNAYCAQNL